MSPNPSSLDHNSKILEKLGAVKPSFSKDQLFLSSVCINESIQVHVNKSISVNPSLRGHKSYSQSLVLKAVVYRSGELRVDPSPRIGANEPVFKKSSLPLKAIVNYDVVALRERFVEGVKMLQMLVTGSMMNEDSSRKSSRRSCKSTTEEISPNTTKRQQWNARNLVCHWNLTCKALSIGLFLMVIGGSMATIESFRCKEVSAS
ncbi:hypothetical protein ACFE04_019837 [Oxalis oulophora]